MERFWFSMLINRNSRFHGEGISIIESSWNFNRLKFIKFSKNLNPFEWKFFKFISSVLLNLSFSVNLRIYHVSSLSSKMTAKLKLYRMFERLKMDSKGPIRPSILLLKYQEKIALKFSGPAKSLSPTYQELLFKF